MIISFAFPKLSKCKKIEMQDPKEKFKNAFKNQTLTAVGKRNDNDDNAINDAQNIQHLSSSSAQKYSDNDTAQF
jgi:hypothetical protein